MRDERKTKRILLDELAHLRGRLEEFEESEKRRKCAEEALGASEANYRAIFDTANDAIFVHDAETGAILDVNRKMTEMYGYSIEEVLRIDVEAMSAGGPSYTQEDAVRLIRKARDGEPQIFEWKAKDKAGRVFWVEVNLKRTVLGGKDRLLAIVRDVTERKRTELELKQYSERLEAMVEQRTKELREAQEKLVHQQKLAVLGQLAGGVAHEMRSPLSTIKTSAYLLRAVLENPEPDVRETLESLDKDVEACEAIIRSLLEFVRARPPVFREVRLHDVLEEVLARLQVPHKVDVAWAMEGDMPSILADPDQIGQVFRNLAENAFQAMPAGGRLVVKSECGTGDWAIVSFTDSGVGIPRQHLETVFEPTFATRTKGIGLGLALSRILVEGHGGSIEVQSDLGQGSTFRIRLPVRGKDHGGG